MEKRKSKLDYAVLYSAFLVYSISSVFAKYAANQTSLVLTMLFLGLEVAFLGVYALIWQQALKRFPLVVAMSNKGITVIYSLIWSVVLFAEKITVNNLIGAALVMLGIGLVSSDG